MSPENKSGRLPFWGTLGLVLAIASLCAAGWFFYLYRIRQEQCLKYSDQERLSAARIGQLQDRITALESDLRRQEESALQKEAEVQTLSQSLVETQNRIAEISREKEKLADALTKLKSDIEKQISSQDVAITQSGNQVTIQITDKIMFDSGRVEVKQGGRAILDKIALALQKFPDRVIRIEGHTDNVAVSDRLKDRYPSNWELSTARAAAAVRYLQENCQIPVERLQAIGYADSRPVAPNDSDENRAKNRRIEIVLMPGAPAPPTLPAHPTP